MKKVIVEFQFDNDVYFDEEELMYSGIKYFHEADDLTVSKVINFIKDFYEKTGLDGGGTEEEIFLRGAYEISDEYIKGVLEEFKDYIDEESKTLKSVIEQNLYYDVVDFLEYHMSVEESDAVIRTIARENNFKFGTVGYSSWAHYLAHDKLSSEYVRSIWDGSNFYTIALVDGNGDFNNSVGRVYAETMEELVEYTLDCFNIDREKGFKVVNNQVGLYVDMPKVREIKNVTYSYEDI